MEKKETKGLFQQILDFPLHDGSFNIKDLEDVINKAVKKDRDNFKRKEKQAKENIKHLVKRSKKLNKEIPLELLYILGSIRTHYVDSEFLNNYKEWLND